MENLKYQQAVNQVQFQKKIVMKIFYMLVFNSIYMAYLLLEKGIWFNKVSIAFLLFSATYLIYFVAKYFVADILITNNKSENFSKGQRFFIINFSIFMAYLFFKISIDFGKFFFEIFDKINFSESPKFLHGYDLVLIWVVFLFFQYYFTFENKIFKNWEERKIKELMQKENL